MTPCLTKKTRKTADNMPRFFKENFKSEPYIDGGDAAHIALSLRMAAGDTVTVCDTCGTEFTCRLTAVSPTLVETEILAEKPGKTEPETKLTLFQCLPKGDKMDLIVRQAVEIGVSSVVPVLSERCVSRPNSAALQKKVARWQKIADAAAGQSGRGIIPQVRPCITFKECVTSLKEFERALFFSERSGAPLGGAGLKKGGGIAVIIGSEGGFSVGEEAAANAAGAESVTLGPRILRCETAPLAAAACIMQLCGEMSI